MTARKQPSEVWTLTYDFTDRLGSATITTVDSAVSTPRGAGANMTKAAGPTVSGKTVLVTWDGGADLEDYLTTVKITASTGEEHELDGIILVRERGFELLSLEEVKQHLRVLHDDEDELIQGYIDAAIATIDGPTGWLGRAISEQTVIERLDSFPRACVEDSIRLRYPPVSSIDSVEYVDPSDGSWAEWDDASWELDNGYLRPAFGESWPAPAVRRDAVRITYQAGYAVLPRPIRAALLLMIGDLYAQRESFVAGPAVATAPMSTSVQSLLAPFRSWFF